MNTELTFNTGPCQDLKMAVSGEYQLPGATVVVEAWPENEKREKGRSESCSIDKNNKWAMADFLILAPENFSENQRIYCLQAVIQLASGIIKSPVKKVTVDIPYEITEQTLKVKTANALAAALSATGKGEQASHSVLLDADILLNAPVQATLTCELNGGGHTLTCMQLNNWTSLLPCITETAILHSLKIVYPEGRTLNPWQAEPEYFAGIVRENKGTIKCCEITVEINRENACCAGIAYTAEKGSKITDCKVSGTLKGKSIGGIVYQLNGGHLEDCTVKTDLQFKEFGGGIVALANSQATINRCNYQGVAIVFLLTYAATRLWGGITAKANENTQILTCNAQNELSMNSSGMGGYAGGIVGHLSSSSISACGATVKGKTHWIYGGIAGKADHASKIEQCVAYSDTAMEENHSVVGGLVGDLGSNSTLSDCYTSQSLKTSVYGGGLIGYGAENAIVERCYCSSALQAKVGGGIKMRSQTPVKQCAGICSYLSGSEEMGRIGCGGNVIGCIACKDTATAPGKTIIDTGEILKEASEFLKQETFTALGWDFSRVWEMDTPGNYPKLREVTFDQEYPYPFLRITSPAGNEYKFKTNDIVAFSGYAPLRARSFKWTLKPVYSQNNNTQNTIPVTAGKWSLSIGKLSARQYQLTLNLSVDGTEVRMNIGFTVE